MAMGDLPRRPEQPDRTLRSVIRVDDRGQPRRQSRAQVVVERISRLRTYSGRSVVATGITQGRRHMAADKTRRTPNTRDAAEAAFKAATTKPPELPPKRPSIPNVRELVSLRIDREVLDHFQEGGPGWQDRINDALRKLIGK